MSSLSQLQPCELWKHFSDLCEIPRPSCHEEAIREHLIQFARQHTLEVITDDIGNIIICKPATPGMEDCKGVILQSHVDMVPQKKAGTEHDFTRDPIQAYVDGEWVTASDTTLGADNGIGVAAAMAVLASDNIAHGPLEALFTVNEESGMSGAHNLQSGILQGNILLNMDSEESGKLCVGCAGGVDVVISDNYAPEPLPVEGMQQFTLTVQGLKGGHSGINIHLDRGNANKLMMCLLKALKPTGFQLAALNGGTLRNAIAKEAFAHIAIPLCNVTQAHQIIDSYTQTLLNEWSDVEPTLSVMFTPAQVSKTSVIPSATLFQWVDILQRVPHGVHTMSQTVPGVVETSNNLAIVAMEEGKINVEHMVRSLVDSARDVHAESIAGLYCLPGADVSIQGVYPGWKPDNKSAILNAMIITHEKLFGHKPDIEIIHAGLECGLLGGTYPHWDMISFGPTIHFPHTPDEKVNIESVGVFWRYLLAVLKQVTEC